MGQNFGGHRGDSSSSSRRVLRVFGGWILGFAEEECWQVWEGEGEGFSLVGLGCRTFALMVLSVVSLSRWAKTSGSHKIFGSPGKFQSTNMECVQNTDGCRIGVLISAPQPGTRR